MDDTLYDSYGGIYSVASVGGSGDILTLRIVQPGITASPPSNPVSMTSSSVVSGSGVTFNLTWSTRNTLSLNPSGGKVSIGTTSPETTLHITSSGSGTTLGQLTRTFDCRTVGAGSEISFRGSVNATDPNTAIYASISAPVTVNGVSGSQGYLAFSTKTTAATALTERMRVTANRNVGIGTTTPYSRLTVWGTGTGTGELFELANSASTTVARFLDNGTGYFLGNIGVGTTTPYSKLEVWGPDTGSTSAFAVVNSASTTAFAVYDNGNAIRWLDMAELRPAAQKGCPIA